MEITLPIIEIRELYRGLTIANNKNYPTQIMENVHVKFEMDRIWGSVIRSSCTQQYVVDFQMDEDSDLDGIEILLPWSQLQKLFSLGIDNAELYLNKKKGTLLFVDGKTEVTMVMDDVTMYPKIKNPDGEALWSMPAFLLRELIACRSMCMEVELKPEINRLLLANKGGMLRSLVYIGVSLVCTSVQLPEAMEGNEYPFFTLSSDFCLHLETKLGQNKDEIVHLSIFDDGSTVIFAHNWFMLEHFIASDLPSRYDVFMGALTISKNEYDTHISTSKKELLRALKISDMVGYEDISPRMINRTLEFERRGNAIFIVNNKLDYGIEAVVELTDAVIEGHQQVHKKLSLAAIGKFINLCREERVQIYFSPIERKPVCFICNNKRMITMEYFR